MRNILNKKTSFSRKCVKKAHKKELTMSGVYVKLTFVAAKAADLKSQRRAK